MAACILYTSLCELYFLAHIVTSARTFPSHSRHPMPLAYAFPNGLGFKDPEDKCTSIQTRSLCETQSLFKNGSGDPRPLNETRMDGWTNAVYHMMAVNLTFAIPQCAHAPPSQQASQKHFCSCNMLDALPEDHLWLLTPP